MQRTEVTVERCEVREVTGHRTAAERAPARAAPGRAGFGVRARQPVVYVTFGDAEA
jgi:hypothetical protein